MPLLTDHWAEFVCDGFTTDRIEDADHIEFDCPSCNEGISLDVKDYPLTGSTLEDVTLDKNVHCACGWNGKVVDGIVTP